MFARPVLSAPAFVKRDGTVLVIYGLQVGTSTSPMILSAVQEKDGTITASGYQAAPAGFTGDGAALFAQSTSPTVLSAIQIGVSRPVTGSG